MGLRDGFSDNILLDNFGYGGSNLTGVRAPTRSEPSSSTTWSIEIIQASSSAAYQKMSDHMISNEYAAR
uniref:Uncharacterized protein n=1 Tax=Oryza glaberrima TaxID=4538 RepID=I1QZA6_ORYGL